MALEMEKTKDYYFYNRELNEYIKKTKKYTGAYIQITNVSGTKKEVELVVSYYTDNKKENKFDTGFFVFRPDVEAGSENFIKQGYEYLKTLAEFKNAVDILE